MFLQKQVRSINLQLPFKLWLLLCVSTLCDEVDGTPTAETVTKARCYANCLTKNPSANKGEEPCQTQSCKDCLIPCEGAFADEITCKRSCNNVNSCLKSCEVLTKIKNFSSILAGDGSLPPSPSVPIIRNRTLTSISLEWVPVENTSGTPVYLVEMDYSASGSMYLSEVSFSTNYTVTLQQLCIPVRRRVFGRSNYNIVFYKFRVAVLTENSSIAYGQQTQQTSLVKPNPVANVSVESFVYDAANAGDKVKLTASITPSNATQHLVTQFAMMVKPLPGCTPYFERSRETTGPQTSLSIHVYQRLMKCEHILQAYSLISCSTSDPVTLRYIYPGCQHITDFPTSICYQFDPPKAPIGDRIVRNIRLEDPLAAQADFRFKGTVIWDVPLYPFKEVQSYVAKMMKESPTDPTGFAYLSHGSSQNSSYSLKDLLPGTTYKIEVRVNFRDYLPSSAWNSVNITTPNIIPAEVAVRNLTLGSFLPSPGGGSFLVNISWQKPNFNYSSLSRYRISYKVGSRDAVLANTNATHLLISGVLHGEMINYQVVPVYQHDWVKGRQVSGNKEAPVPLDVDIKVKNLNVGPYVAVNGTDTFFVNFSWTGPAFNFTFLSYDITYELTGYSTETSIVHNVKIPTFNLSGIRPKEFVKLKVTPLFKNQYIKGIEEQYTTTAPEPKEDLVKVIGLQYDKPVSGPDNTFGATLRWEKPLFTHSEVKHYVYRVMSANAPSARHRRDTNLNTGIETSDTNATISGINRNEDVEVQVTPVFVVSAVTGKNEKIMLAWKDDSDRGAVSNKLPPSAIGGLIAGLLIVALLIICLVVLSYINKQKRRLKRGIVSGKNALMIDEWEVDGDLVSLEEELGEGAFGKVYKGILKEINTPPRKLSTIPPNALTKSTIKQSTGYTVAIKMLHGMADSEQRREFLEEIQLMKAVGSHKNIVNMVGCCTVEEPMFLLTEYVPYGDLLHYLRKRRGKVKEYLGDESRGPYRSTYCETYVIDGTMRGEVSIKATRSDRIYVNTPGAPKADSKDIQILSFTQRKNEVEQLGTENKGITEEEGDNDIDEDEGGLTPGDLLAFAWQISQGMEYLARKGFVHRDLAARNVLVGEHKVAKVADFGLTRYVYEEKVYHTKRNRKLPLKWMSIEAIFDQTFTAQSDVWAFGVVLWELVTLGGTPYPTINNRELLRLLKEGYRMEKPDICNEEIYEMMTQCWMESPDERPNFTQIRERLEAMMQIDNPYLDFSVLDESRDYYNVPSFNSLEDEASDDEILDKSEDGQGSKDEDEPGDDPQWNELDALSQGFKRLNKGGDNPFDFTFENNNLNGKDFRDLKDVKVNLDAIEMSLYRPGNRGLVL